MYGGLSVQLNRWRSNMQMAGQTMCLIGESDVLYPFIKPILPPLRNLAYVAADDRNFTTKPFCAALKVPPLTRALASPWNASTATGSTTGAGTANRVACRACP